MPEVKFKFQLYERVQTPLANGIVTMLGVDEGGNTYFVCTNQQGASDRWWPESRLAPEQQH